jgi:hypothetical protein
MGFVCWNILLIGCFDVAKFIKLSTYLVWKIGKWQCAPRSPTCRTADKKGKRTDTDLVDKMESQGVRVLRNTGDLQEWKYDDKAGGRQLFLSNPFWFLGISYFHKTVCFSPILHTWFTYYGFLHYRIFSICLTLLYTRDLHAMVSFHHRIFSICLTLFYTRDLHVMVSFTAGYCFLMKVMLILTMDFSLTW